MNRSHEREVPLCRWYFYRWIIWMKNKDETRLWSLIIGLYDLIVSHRLYKLLILDEMGHLAHVNSIVCIWIRTEILPCAPGYNGPRYVLWMAHQTFHKTFTVIASLINLADSSPPVINLRRKVTNMSSSHLIFLIWRPVAGFVFLQVSLAKEIQILTVDMETCRSISMESTILNLLLLSLPLPPLSPSISSLSLSQKYALVFQNVWGVSWEEYVVLRAHARPL